MSAAIQLRQARPDDIEGVKALLVGHALPIEDLNSSQVEFLVAVEEGRLRGVAGLERFGDAGLLRSVAVDPACQGTGLGSLLVANIETQAADSGLRQLALLTQTAAPFFARRGYTVVERTAVPQPVQASAEFRSICPSSATCMVKQLGAAR